MNDAERAFARHRGRITRLLTGLSADEARFTPPDTAAPLGVAAVANAIAANLGPQLGGPGELMPAAPDLLADRRTALTGRAAAAGPRRRGAPPPAGLGLTPPSAWAGVAVDGSGTVVDLARVAADLRRSRGYRPALEALAELVELAHRWRLTQTAPAPG
jgi:hypothetical protein